MSADINEQLASFSKLANLYSFGQPRTVKTGLHMEKALAQKRLSLIQVFSQGKLVDYGPKLVGEVLIQEPSSGEESEVEITNLFEDNRLISDKTLAEGKAGPRVHHVVQEILDLNWIYPTVSSFNFYFSVKDQPVLHATNYLRIEGMEVS